MDYTKMGQTLTEKYKIRQNMILLVDKYFQLWYYSKAVA